MLFRSIDRGIRRSVAALAVLEAKTRSLGKFIFDDLVAKIDALIADINAGTGNQFLHLLLGLATEGALQKIAAFTDASHDCLLSSGKALMVGLRYARTLELVVRPERN